MSGLRFRGWYVVGEMGKDMSAEMTPSGCATRPLDTKDIFMGARLPSTGIVHHCRNATI